MEFNKNSRPPESQMKKDGKVWWTWLNDRWVKCIPYNKKEEVPVEPKGDGPLETEQFNKVMSSLDILMTRFDILMSRFDGLEAKVDANTASIKKIDTNLKNLTAIVKKNHPEDF